MPNPPRRWQPVELGAVAEINPASPKLSLSEKEISVLDVGSIAEKTGLINAIETRIISKVPASATVVRDGDILLAKNSPHLEQGRVAIASGLANGHGFFLTGFHVIRPKRRLAARWLWYFLRQRKVREQAEQTMKISGGKKQVPPEFLTSLALPLPSLGRQQSIVNLLDEAEVAHSLQRESILETEKMVLALFTKMFGEPEKNPKGWESSPLSDLLEKIVAGTAQHTSKPPGGPGELAVVTPKAVTSGVFMPEESLALSKQLPTNKHLLKGDLLMSWMNKGALVGTVALVEEDYDTLFLPESLWKLVPQPGVSTCFLKALLSLLFVQQRIRDRASGTSLARIVKSQFMAMPVFKPPPTLQARFAEIYWDIVEARRSQETLSTELDHLLASLRERVFPHTPTTTVKARAKKSAAKKSTRAVKKKASSVKRARRETSVAEGAVGDDRIIWHKLSAPQRDIWTASKTVHQPFRITDLIEELSVRKGEAISRERILFSLDLLVSLGVILKEGRQDADRWRSPNPEIDREIEV